MPREKRVKLQPDDPETHRPQLIVGIAAYNWAEKLEKAIGSVKGVADKIVVVEGKFSDSPGAYVRSVDKTADIARDLGAELIQPHIPLPQPQQRDLYLIGEPGDVYLVLDSDEVLQGVFPKQDILKGTPSCYAVWIEGPLHWSPRPQLTLRVYRHISGTPHHNPGQILVDGEGRLMDGTHPGFGGILGTCKLQHLK